VYGRFGLLGGVVTDQGPEAPGGGRPADDPGSGTGGDVTERLIGAIDRLERRLGALETRVSEIERGGSESVSSASAGRSSGRSASAPPTGPAAGSEVVSAGETPPPLPAASKRKPGESAFGASPKPFKLAASGAREPRAGGGGGLSLEVLLGGRAFAVIGSLVVIVAVGLGLKIAWDAGYLRVPPGWRCGLTGVFGLALIGAGEALRVRVNRWAFAFTAAGLGTVYTAAWATHGAFGLVGSGTGLVMLAAVAGFGIALSAWSGVAWVSVLSLLGGFAAPLLVEGGDPPAWVMPGYFLMLLVVGLGLAAWRGEAFAGARQVGTIGAGLVGLLLVASRGGESSAVSLGFVSLFVALTHGELVWSGSRGRFEDAGRMLDGALNRAARSILLSPLVTASSCAVAVFVLAEADAERMRWVAPALIGVVLVGGAGVLGVPAGSAVAGGGRRLGILLFGQGLAYGLVAVSLGLAGWTEPAALLAIGAAVAVAGRLRRTSWLAWYGLVSLAFGGARLFGHWVVGAGFAGPHELVLGVAWSRWTLLASMAALAWGVAAWAAGGLREQRGLRSAGLFAWALAFGWLLLAPLHEASGSRGVFWVWTGLSAAAVGVLYAVRDRPALALRGWPEGWLVSFVSFLGLTAAGGAWVVAFLSPASEGWRASDAMLFMHPGLIAGLGWAVVVGAYGFAHRAQKQGERDPEGTLVGESALFAAGLAALGVSSLEVSRSAVVVTANELTQRATVSLWWGVFGAGLLILGWMLRARAARVSGLVLILIASAKALLYDIAGVEPIWRVAALVVLGLLMMVVAAFYLRGRVTRSRRTEEFGAPEVMTP